jgi:hypothetical protein
VEHCPFHEGRSIVTKHLSENIETTVREDQEAIALEESWGIHHPRRDAVPSVANQTLWIDRNPALLIALQDVLVMQIAIRECLVRLRAEQLARDLGA